MKGNDQQSEPGASGHMGLQFMRLSGSDSSGNDYLRATEMGYFMSRLLEHLAAAPSPLPSNQQQLQSSYPTIGRPPASAAALAAAAPAEDVVDVCSEFFRKLASGSYVSEVPFPGILQAHHSRVCLSRNCLRALKDVPPAMDVTTCDLHSILTLLCADIPLSFVADAATYVSPLDATVAPPRYAFGELCQAFHFTLVFKDWLALFIAIFDLDNNQPSISLTKDVFISRFDALISSTVDSALGVQLPVLGSMHAAISELLADKPADYSVTHYLVVKYMCESNDVRTFLQTGSML